ncbi:MAG: dethiobiotin synthase [Thermodesulfobacteriota bacterium]|nr:dethiobiotin synthase [Thermodesulfobacteriota bacterium]
MSNTEFFQRMFVTGTDTGVGKTVVAAILLRGLRGVYWKPVQSGVAPMTDTQWVRDITGLDDSHFISESYVLNTPASPHLSAAMDGVRINMDEISMPAVGDTPLIIEGAGGVLVPLNTDRFIADLIKGLDVPALVVAPSGLGMINHTLLTLDQLRSRDIPVLGVVMNGEPHEANKKAVEHYGRVPVIAEIPPLPEMTPAALDEAFDLFTLERRVS